MKKTLLSVASFITTFAVLDADEIVGGQAVISQAVGDVQLPETDLMKALKDAIASAHVEKDELGMLDLDEDIQKEIAEVEARIVDLTNQYNQAVQDQQAQAQQKASVDALAQENAQRDAQIAAFAAQVKDVQSQFAQNEQIILSRTQQGIELAEKSSELDLSKQQVQERVTQSAQKLTSEQSTAARLEAVKATVRDQASQVQSLVSRG
jgi:chromosome segregation ATPase